MKQPIPATNWPETWRSSYQFDQNEAFGNICNRGYAYAYGVRRQKTLDLLTSALSPPASILDIAAAQGNFSLCLAEMGFNVTWNDLRSELIGYVQQKHEHGAISYRSGNAFELDFPSLFDGVLITEVIEHVAHPDRFLEMTARLVKQGGYIVMTTPNGGYLRNTLPRFSDCPDPSIFEQEQFRPDADGHLFLLYEDEIRRFASAAGLVVDEILYFTNLLTNGHLKTSTVLNIVPKSFVDWVESVSQKLPSRLARRLLLQVGVRFYKP